MSTGLLRDQFLHALDANNHEAALHLASFLGASTNPLPTEVCTRLGLPRGSTYSAAAQKIAAGPAPVVPAPDPGAAT
jgi:hypothetical protein